MKITTENIQQLINETSSLSELCELLNDFESMMDDSKTDRIASGVTDYEASNTLGDCCDLCDLPTFGGEHSGSCEVFSYDKDGELFGDGDISTWYIQPRD